MTKNDKCPKCGNLFYTGDKCHTCGYTPSKDDKCPKCGNTFYISGGGCGSCGYGK